MHTAAEPATLSDLDSIRSLYNDTTENSLTTAKTMLHLVEEVALKNGWRTKLLSIYIHSEA